LLRMDIHRHLSHPVMSRSSRVLCGGESGTRPLSRKEFPWADLFLCDNNYQADDDLSGDRGVWDIVPGQIKRYCLGSDNMNSSVRNGIIYLEHPDKIVISCKIQFLNIISLISSCFRLCLPMKQWLRFGF
jgi:hypothetical protein